ncbi:MAG: BON domain-containing protein [Dysgonamonadaceae bacterium]|nr:BON domain-containing protein [Dysgonamonadaceae bacterium]MDD4728091.1 BON domain-containing protein [Dysgonamonadaceae bacterium]
MKKIRFLSMLSVVFLLGVGLTNCDKVKDSELEEKATELIATNPDAGNVSVSVIDKVATLSGTVENEATKNQVQSSIMEVEGIKSVLNNIRVVPPPKVEEPVIVEEDVSDQVKVATRKGKLNVHNKPGVQEFVITVVQHGEMLTLVEKVSDDWWLIETQNGVKGYSHSRYLEQQ